MLAANAIKVWEERFALAFVRRFCFALFVAVSVVMVVFVCFRPNCEGTKNEAKVTPVTLITYSCILIHVMVKDK